MKSEIYPKEEVVVQVGNRLHEFKSGQFGIIRKWKGTKAASEAYIGNIVKRVDNVLFSLNHILSPEIHDEKWSDFEFLCKLDGEFYIEPLKPGTQILITI